jgi:NAD(P)H-dependent FMN reductase
MATFNVGYLVGSLATKSINRLLAKALVRVAPPELQLTEISFKDLPPVPRLRNNISAVFLRSAIRR